MILFNLLYMLLKFLYASIFSAVGFSNFFFNSFCFVLDEVNRPSVIQDAFLMCFLFGLHFVTGKALSKVDLKVSMTLLYEFSAHSVSKSVSQMSPLKLLSQDKMSDFLNLLLGIIYEKQTLV